MPNLEEKKESVIDQLSNSGGLFIMFIGIFALGIAKKCSDFLIRAAINEHDKIIKKQVEEHLKPIQDKLGKVENALEKLSEAVHDVVTKKNYSNVRSELLMETLEEIFGKEELKKILQREQVKILNEKD